MSPGETISLLNELVPFSTENGYFDGLIISRGNIVPDIGGGICQVSTTLYRAAMNSGLKITGRKNHSTWISWYNDIRNKNPGTDATLYHDDTGGGASIDLKFTNDTNNYILIKTKTDKKGNLNIEIWGKKDGREASFTAPEVEEKIPATTTVAYILDKKKFFTEKKCSGPFEGAKASFFYNIKMPGGSTTSEKISSYYPAQGKSCLVNEKEIARLENKLKDKKVSQAEKGLIKIVKD
jgi:vancomycin resistance protein YoaR